MYASVQALVDSEPKLPPGASFRAILYQNAPLETTQNTALVCDLLNESRNHLRELNAEITLLTDALSRLKGQKKRVSEHIRVCHMAIHSPIRALPDDVMCEIFSLSVERAPWEPLRELTRARDLPFSIEIWERSVFEHGYMSEWMDWSEWNAIVEKMERHAAYMGQILGDPNTLPTHRIRDLRLVGHAQSILPALSSLPRDAFPLLERLHLRILVDEDWVKKLDKAPSIVAFTESTRLWHLRLEDRIPDFFFTHLYQRSLTDVNLSLYEPIPSQLVLGQCTQLERLHINSLTTFRRLFDKDFDLVTLDRLKLLSLRGTECYLLAPKLSTPSLESFSCSDADDVLTSSPSSNGRLE
ncbi:uncharacterized protein SCHCODRAFT_02482494 [Schizophyllum commune H4-8]|nr:uncharacterized protein SCHCODRAFT_02482494 [Schizophyllum commune H4-8]KAI5899337.1 hypothetical protein SCHCODRAFT_02482494 [Schizophyllum commune H4-8]